MGDVIQFPKKPLQVGSFIMKWCSDAHIIENQDFIHDDRIAYKKWLIAKIDEEKE